MDDLPDGAFDLIHARMLLEHLPARDRVLKSFVAALRPGGWVMIEDIDMRGILAERPLTWTYPPGSEEREAGVWRGVFRLMDAAGHDAEYGYRLPAELAGAGVDDVGAEMRAPMFEAGPRAQPPSG